jgi:hypothetical protein
LVVEDMILDGVEGFGVTPSASRPANRKAHEASLRIVLPGRLDSKPYRFFSVALAVLPALR